MPETEYEPIVTEAEIESRNWNRKQGPFYRVDEAAKLFFGMSASWMRLKLTASSRRPETWFVRNGHRMEFRRLPHGPGAGARQFWLSDIEPMARSLLAFNSISDRRLELVLDVVRAEAALYGLAGEPIDDSDDDPGADD